MSEDANLELLWHSIGMKRSNYRRSLEWWLDNSNHRNAFCASVSPPSHDLPRLEALVEQGLMNPGFFINDKRDRYFHVTSKGVVYAKANFPRPARKEKSSPSGFTLPELLVIIAIIAIIFAAGAPRVLDSIAIDAANASVKAVKGVGR